MTDLLTVSPIELGNRAFVFGGAYGNLQATEAVLEKAGELGFLREQIIFTGDTVAYCGQPAETAHLIRESCGHIIQGNCEESLGENADDCGCGFEDGSACSMLSVEWYRYCQQKLSEETKKWMRTLPKSLEFAIGSYKFRGFHGSEKAINEFIFPSDLQSGSVNANSIQKFDGFVVGHSGIPFVSEINGKAWINSGAAGMPANDGTARIWFATIEASVNSFTVETHALDYDHSAAADAMHRAELSAGYRDCLTSGTWPSNDVLPEAERLQTGIALKAQKKAFKRVPLSEVA